MNWRHDDLSSSHRWKKCQEPCWTILWKNLLDTTFGEGDSDGVAELGPDDGFLYLLLLWRLEKQSTGYLTWSTKYYYCSCLPWSFGIMEPTPTSTSWSPTCQGYLRDYSVLIMADVAVTTVPRCCGRDAYWCPEWPGLSMDVYICLHSKEVLAFSAKPQLHVPP